MRPSQIDWSLRNWEWLNSYTVAMSVFAICGSGWNCH